MKEIIRRKGKWLIGAMYSLKYCIIFLVRPEYLRSMSYRGLYFIGFFSKKLFYKVKSKIIVIDEEKLHDLSKINIGFITYSPSMWTMDSLYNKFLSNDNYNVELIVARFNMPSNEAIDSTFEQAKVYFKNELHYNFITPNDDKFDIDKYDILFYCTPFDFCDEIVNARNIKQRTLICYSCYSYMLAEKIDKLDLPIYMIAWKLFCDSKYYKKLLEKKSRIYSNNAYYCGFAKMDAFYQKKPECLNSKKMIIVAPHHSLTDDRTKFSTFDVNYRYLISLVDKYKEFTDWVLKPHPLLKAQSVKAGLFENENKYDEYIKEWNSRENAQVIENGEYVELFLKSDAMITDSVSFIAEYQFTGKPLLLLQSGRQKYNEFGEKIENIVYKCSGDDFKSIEEFVNMVINGQDPQKKIRANFFEQELDYYKENGKIATEFMYTEIDKYISKF